MHNPEEAVKIIQTYQVAILAPLLNPKAVNSWLFQKENAHATEMLAWITDSILTFLKKKTLTGNFVSSTNKSRSVYQLQPEVIEKAFIEALIGDKASELFFSKIYLSYCSDVSLSSTVEPVAIDSKKLFSLLKDNMELCFAIQRLRSDLSKLNNKFPRDLVPEEWLLINNYVEPKSTPKLRMPACSSKITSLYFQPDDLDSVDLKQAISSSTSKNSFFRGSTIRKSPKFAIEDSQRLSY